MPVINTHFNVKRKTKSYKLHILVFLKLYLFAQYQTMGKHILLITLFFSICFFCKAQENKYRYNPLKKNWVKTMPNITFCGKTEGIILLDSLSAESIISISPPYTFHSLSVYFGGSGFANPILTGFIGTTSKELITFYKISPLKDLIKKCNSGTKIVLTNIIVIKDKLIYDALDVTYIVK